MKVTAKKYLGQHFLKDLNIAEKISSSLCFHGSYNEILEIGPGTGVLTKYLLALPNKNITAIDVDQESVAYLSNHSEFEKLNLIEGDVLRLDLEKIMNSQFGLIGNFPYNISSQIFFKVLEYKHVIPEVVCMIQKEVAERICASEGSKTYGILSVLTGAFYERKILFKVPPQVFDPPPKVDSAVIQLKIKDNPEIPFSQKALFRVVKAAFQKRRKTLRNALKQINLPLEMQEDEVLNLRAEQLSIDRFIELTAKIELLWKT